SLIEFTHPQNALYIFGPEDGSIPQAIVDQADFVVFVPTIGCMNLAATVNVVLYDRLAKSAAVIDHSALIKNSRDTNNRLKRDKA
ncbi:MAG: TrmH family RNA methyltransferase, partial [Pseudohongiella sp.]|nr:TrmH family RNA methyltransferase [Pseudohongiella sp.]